jgi:iron complex transport system permease protein
MNAPRISVEATLDAYRRVVHRRVVLILALAFGCGAGFLADLLTGPSAMPLPQTISTLLSPASADPAAQVIVWQLRLPVALMALLVGAALSLAGAEMQTILDNPLASPFTLGVSSAAAFGAALAIILGLGIPGVPPAVTVTANALLFAFGSVLLLQVLARHATRGPDELVLLGIALVFTFEAAVSLLQFVASADALQQLVFWTMGSLARADVTAIGSLALVIAICAPFSLRAAWQMTALRFGEERARSLGIDVGRLRFFSLLRVSLLAATAVAFVGTVGFVGLVGPHIARMLIGEDQRFFLPASALTGALLMSLASIASKSVMPGVLVPISIVTAFVGLPLFFWLILRRGGVR